MSTLITLPKPSDRWIVDLLLDRKLSEFFIKILEVKEYGDSDTKDKMTQGLHTIMFTLGIVDWNTIYRGHVLRDMKPPHRPLGFSLEWSYVGFPHH